MKDILPAKAATRKKKSASSESETCTFLLPYIKLLY